MSFPVAALTVEAAVGDTVVVSFPVPDVAPLTVEVVVADPSTSAVLHTADNASLGGVAVDPDGDTAAWTWTVADGTPAGWYTVRARTVGTGDGVVARGAVVLYPRVGFSYPATTYAASASLPAGVLLADGSPVLIDGLYVVV